ncbi:MAG: hypothetical protein NUV82_01225 [Candidatus Komeilibacteria bacterium]|nr:hypothetical protein [Candidatus Komeilibacteria bacterium]
MKRMLLAQIVVSVITIALLLLSRTDWVGNPVPLTNDEQLLVAFRGNSLIFTFLALFVVLLLSAIFEKTNPEWLIASMAAIAGVFWLMAWYINEKEFFLIIAGICLLALVLFLYGDKVAWPIKKTLTTTVFQGLTIVLIGLIV